MRGSCVTKMKILRYSRSSSSARVRWMPAFSTSSSSTMGVLQMIVASAMRSARVWPPESSVMRLSTRIGSPVNWLAKLSVRSSIVATCAPAALRMRAWVSRNSPDGQVGEERGVLRDQGDGIAGRVVAIFRGRARAVDEDAPARRRIGVGEQLDVVDERGLARAGRPDDADHVAHPQVNALHGLGLARLAAPAEDRDGLDHISLLFR